MKSLLFTTMIMSGAISLSLILAPAVAAQPLRPPDQKSKFRQVEEPIKGRYIVVLKDNVPAASISLMGDEMVSAYGGKVRHKFMHALKGFVSEMSEGEAQQLSHDPRVEFVEEDGVVYGDADSSQDNPSWGLDRIDQRNLPLNNIYSYQGSGFGVNAYVIDSGILATHQEFVGRVFTVRDYIGDGQNGNDCNGHGTHVAGILGGTNSGVAKDVRIHSLRVLNCAKSGATSNIIKAVDWVRANHVKPAVTNMSLGSSGSDSLDKAVRNLTAAGVPVVVAAGNGNVNADTRSPARVTEAITVGATDNTDTRPTNWQCPGTPPVFTCGSNFGTVVDVFAPGNNITSAWIGSSTATNAIGGTSMAAPHVAGMVARYLETDPYASPSAVSSLIVRNATNGVVGTPGTGSPNRLLYTVLPKPTDQQRYGDFNGDYKADILVQSAWGMGILTYEGSSLTRLIGAPNGTWFGGWNYNSANDHIVAIADFNLDFQDDILITSRWGVGILSFNGSSLTTLMGAPNGTWFGGWRFDSERNRIVGTGDFNGDGRQDIVVTSGWGIGILTYDGSSLTTLMGAPNETWFGGWRFQSPVNTIEGFGDINGDGKDDILIRSAWGIGILTLNETTLTSLMVAPNGTNFGGGNFNWPLNSRADRIAGLNNFDGGLDDEILITSKSGLAILGWNGSALTVLAKASNGTRLGGWLLDTRVNQIGRIGDVNDIFKDEIIIRSAWGIGILTLNGSTLTTLTLAPNGTRFGGWLYNSANDQILGVGNFGGGLTNDILVTSPWGIGILRFGGTSLDSRMLAPNGTRFGGWLFDSTVNQVGIYGDIY